MILQECALNATVVPNFNVRIFGMYRHLYSEQFRYNCSTFSHSPATIKAFVIM